MNLAQISEHLSRGDAVTTSVLVNRALSEHYSAEAIVRQGFIAGIASAESRYRETIAPEIRMAERALKRGIRHIQAAIDASPSPSRGIVILGTIEGEYDGLYKNLLQIMMRSLGLRVEDLGTSVPPKIFLEQAMRKKAGIICVSMMHSFDPSPLKSLVQAAFERGVRKSIKIILSGATVTEGLCRSIGADYYASGVESAAEYAASYYQKKNYQKLS
jgi:5-methyltetrahydrofolate--homocysteine methyltransferase